MGRPSIDDDKFTFIERLKTVGGNSGNVSLRSALGWDEDRYWRTHGLLSDEGTIVRGRGKGGSIAITERPAEIVSSEIVEPIEREIITRELDLYQPAKLTIETTWVKEMAFDDHLVEITALPGRRHTGGTWTRPDVSVLATKAYPYFPTKSFEIITFEIKPAYAVDVTAVFEALSHAQFATQSYVLFCGPGIDFEKDMTELPRVFALAAQHGIGVILATYVEDYNSWDERIRPRRNSVDPEQSNLFISTCFSETAKSRVIKWHK